MNWPLTIEIYNPLVFLLGANFFLITMLLLALGIRQGLVKIERRVEGLELLATIQPSKDFLDAIKAVDKMEVLEK